MSSNCSTQTAVYIFVYSNAVFCDPSNRIHTGLTGDVCGHFTEAAESERVLSQQTRCLGVLLLLLAVLLGQWL